MSRAECLRRRRPPPVLPWSTGVELSAKEWAWAIKNMGIRPLLDCKGIPWKPPNQPALIPDPVYTYTVLLRPVPERP